MTDSNAVPLGNTVLTGYVALLKCRECGVWKANTPVTPHSKDDEQDKRHEKQEKRHELPDEEEECGEEKRIKKRKTMHEGNDPETREGAREAKDELLYKCEDQLRELEAISWLFKKRKLEFMQGPAYQELLERHREGAQAEWVRMLVPTPPSGAPPEHLLKASQSVSKDNEGAKGHAKQHNERTQAEHVQRRIPQPKIPVMRFPDLFSPGQDHDQDTSPEIIEIDSDGPSAAPAAVRPSAAPAAVRPSAAPSAVNPSAVPKPRTAKPRGTAGMVPFKAAAAPKPQQWAPAPNPQQLAPAQKPLGFALPPKLTRVGMHASPSFAHGAVRFPKTEHAFAWLCMGENMQEP